MLRDRVRWSLPIGGAAAAPLCPQWTVAVPGGRRGGGAARPATRAGRWRARL